LREFVAGDLTTFPPTTNLVVGEGFSKSMLPLYPTNPESTLFEKELEYVSPFLSRRMDKINEC
jgi:hypothetical protein